jgi:UDP-2,4-diacetamido-2,4,6-trideoxy-beta-L-altropyranose hydrolase
MNVLFRVDSSFEIGIGHLMRCLVLADQYKEDNVFFATQNLIGNINQKIVDKGYNLIALTDGSVDGLIQRIKDLNINMVIFDHYDIDSNFEKEVKILSGVKILSIDDIYKKHHCDILLNHNIYAEVSKYKGLVPDFCELRCGKKYPLIRNEFKNVKLKNKSLCKDKKVIFLCLGGTDRNNISLNVLKILANFDDIILNLATTSSNKNIKKLLDFSKHHKNINICINCNIAELMSKSDFAIISPSVIVHEVMCMKLPFIAIKTADNQEIMYQYLVKNNYPVFTENELHLLSKEIRNYA